MPKHGMCGKVGGRKGEREMVGLYFNLKNKTMFTKILNAFCFKNSLSQSSNHQIGKIIPISPLFFTLHYH